MKDTDYNVYVLSAKQRAFYIALAAAALALVGYLFYRNLVFSILLTPLALFYPSIKTKEIIKKRKNELNIQFRDMLYSLSSSLSSGKPIEIAVSDVLKDLSVLYPDPDTDILREVERIVKKLELNETIESAFSDFAERAHLEDIDNFVDVLKTCKRMGGNMVEVIRNTTNIISDRIEIMQEVNTLLAEKRFEQKVLAVMPVIIIMLLSLSAQDYIEPVFSTAVGRIVMTLSLALLAAANIISKKITDIKV